MAEPNARDQALEAEKAGIEADKAGLDAEQAALDAMKKELIAREERVAAQEEWLKAEKESLETANKEVESREEELYDRWCDNVHRKLDYNKKIHECSVLDGLKLTLQLMDNAAEHPATYLAVIAALKNTLVLQVRHLLANDAGFDLTIWDQAIKWMQHTLKSMDDIELQGTLQEDISSKKDELVKTVRFLLEDDIRLYHKGHVYHTGCNQDF